MSSKRKNEHGRSNVRSPSPAVATWCRNIVKRVASIAWTAVNDQRMAECPVNKSMMPDFYNSTASIVWQLWDGILSMNLITQPFFSPSPATVWHEAGTCTTAECCGVICALQPPFQAPSKPSALEVCFCCCARLLQELQLFCLWAWQ